MMMIEAKSAKPSRSKERKPQTNGASERLLDRELGDLPADLRWREWMMRVEAVIFASVEPVSREVLARVVGKDCSIDLLIDDLREEIRSRPYELVSVAGGWQHRPVSVTPTQYGPLRHLRDQPRLRYPSSKRLC